MSLYRCSACGCVENTALANYWHCKMEQQPLLCSACDPEIGIWHGQFTQQSATGMLIDGAGHLWHPRTLMSMPAHATIVGIVQEDAQKG